MVNKLILVGNVGKDPEVKPAGDSRVANFPLATTEKFKDKEDTQWHRIIVWGKLADIVEKYVKKGDRLYIEGKVKYRNYEKDGAKVYVTEIFVDSLKMLGGKPKSDYVP